MADATVTLKIGDVEPLFGVATADTGTFTISGTPTYALTTEDGTAVASGNTTGHDAGASASVECWYTLSTVGRTAGWYKLVFTLVVTGSDGIVRTYHPTIRIHIVPVIT